MVMLIVIMMVMMPVAVGLVGGIVPILLLLLVYGTAKVVFIFLCVLICVRNCSSCPTGRFPEFSEGVNDL